MKKLDSIIVDHIKFILNERMALIEEVAKKNGDEDYAEGYLDAIDFILNLIESEESEIKL